MNGDFDGLRRGNGIAWDNALINTFNLCRNLELPLSVNPWQRGSKYNDEVN